MFPLRLHMLFIVVLCAAALLAGCDIGPITPPGINQAPTADAGADQTVEVGQRVTLDGLGSTDPDDDPLTFSWQQRSGPSVTLDDANSTQASFLPVEDGFYEFALTVTDGQGGSDTSVVRVFVGDVDPETCPRADAGVDQTVNEGGAVTLRGCNSADPAGGPLDYEWFQVSGAQVSINGVFVCEPAFAAPQVTGADIELEFELTVCNEQGCCHTDTVVITVRDRDPADPCKDVVCADDGLFCNGVEVCVDGECHEGEPPCAEDEVCNEDVDECISLQVFHVHVYLELTYQGLGLENEATWLEAFKESPLEGVRVRLPNGELLDVPEWSNPMGGAGFAIQLPGPPEVGAPYTFEGLDGAGDPIEGFTCVAVYSGTRVDPPRSVQAAINDGTLVLVWDQVNPTEGFDPDLGTGGYSLELFGADGVYYSEATAEPEGTITPDEFQQVPPGTYTLVVYSYAEAIASSCHPDDFTEDCIAHDLLEHVQIEINDDGTISLVGGECTADADCDDGEECNPETGECELIDGMLVIKAATLDPGRARFPCATDPTTGKIYCFGGWDGAGVLGEIVEYDPLAETLEDTGASLLWGLAEFDCAADPATGKIYCFGGVDASGPSGFRDEILVYDPVANTLEDTGARLPTTRENAGCAASPATGKIYIFGGDDGPVPLLREILAYDPANPEVDPVDTGARLPSGRETAPCVADPATGKIYCFGGDDDEGGNIFDEILEYDPAFPDQDAVIVAYLPSERTGLACAMSPATGKIYCFGGRDFAAAFDKILEYDPANPSQNPVIMTARLPLPRSGLACAADPATGKISCFGGSGFGDPPLGEIIEYTPPD